MTGRASTAWCATSLAPLYMHDDYCYYYDLIWLVLLYCYYYFYVTFMLLLHYIIISLCRPLRGH